jgi:hypothetical protein
LPLCDKHHREQGDKGLAHIKAKYGIDLEVLGVSLAIEHLAAKGNVMVVVETPWKVAA